MLKSFSVSNFRGFVSPIEIRLDRASDYHFNTYLVNGTFVKNGLIYGENGSGKTSLLKAMAHIVPTLTNHFASSSLVSNMDCGSSEGDHTGVSIFTYDFFLENENILYTFAKNRLGLVYEEVYSEGKLVLSTKDKKLFVDESFFKELSNANWAGFYDGKISLVKFLGRSGIKFAHTTLSKIVSFAESFLLVRSVIDGNEFAGFLTSPGSLLIPLLKPQALKEFEAFLNKCGLNYKLEIETTQNPLDPKLNVVFKKEKRDFLNVASSGTRFLLLVFSWVKTINDSASFLCIDEFDAYFHDDVAQRVFELLSKVKCQVLLTTHRTSLMNNSIARPDVLFNLKNGKIVSFSESAGERELREAHNIEKLYRNGAFDFA